MQQNGYQSSRTIWGRGDFERHAFPKHIATVFDWPVRSRSRFRRRMEDLEAAFLRGEISEQTLQDRATALVAFTKAGRTKSWKFRSRVLKGLPVSGHEARTG